MYSFPPPYSNFYKKSIRKSNFQKDNYKNNKTLKNDSDPSIDYINILGIKLYLDDLIILFIIFILYKDGNTDSGLIICLLLLLLN